MRVGWQRFRGFACSDRFAGRGRHLRDRRIDGPGGALLLLIWLTSAGILGAALAPTDPAVMFSVLGKREIGGRTGHDPRGRVWRERSGRDRADDRDARARHACRCDLRIVVREFVVEMTVGLAIGVAGAFLVIQAIRWVDLPNPALYPLPYASPPPGVIYGVAAIAHGSGFLAVFVAGIIIGSADLPEKRNVERFHTSLASLAEIVVFVALGLTVNQVALGDTSRLARRAPARGSARLRSPPARRRAAALAGPATARRAAVRHVGAA